MRDTEEVPENHFAELILKSKLFLQSFFKPQISDLEA